MSQVDSPTCR